MNDTSCQITTPDGSCDALSYVPDSGARASGVLLITDAGGIRPVFREMARRIAAAGHVVLLPNMYYRLQPAPLFEAMPNLGDPAVMARIIEIMGTLTPEAVTRDVGAYVDYLTGPLGVTGSIGAVGYCMGGAIALRTAAARPERVAAAASFHGGRLVTEAGASPHLLLPKIKARLYFGHAINDNSMPAGRIAQLEAALKAAGLRFDNEIYNAKHGFAVVDHKGAYDEAACVKHWDTLLELFRVAL